MSQEQGKHQKFVSQPMGQKLVTKMPGIGNALMEKLQAAGFETAQQVFDQYLALDKNSERFCQWLKKTCKANNRQAEKCCQALSEWSQNSARQEKATAGISKPEEIEREPMMDRIMGFLGIFGFLMISICLIVVLMFLCVAPAKEHRAVEDDWNIFVTDTLGLITMHREFSEPIQAWKSIFWNVRGVAKKDDNFWAELGKYDVIGLVETFASHKTWFETSWQQPKGYNWTIQEAKMNGRSRGRPEGGMVIGVREDLVVDDEEKREDPEGLMTRRIKVGSEIWTYVLVYANKDKDMTLETLSRWMKERGDTSKTIIAGDFNARTGEAGGKFKGQRRSMDKNLNTDGRKVIRVLHDVGWSILNGSVPGDEDGAFTCKKGSSNTVIDYVFVNDSTRNRVEHFAIGDRMTSDHHPLILTMKL